MYLYRYVLYICWRYMKLYTCWRYMRSNLMCILLYFHIGDSYRMGEIWHLPFISAIAGKKSARKKKKKF